MKNFEIYIDGKKAHSLMFRNQAKHIALKYGYKIDHWFVTSGEWMTDEKAESLIRHSY